MSANYEVGQKAVVESEGKYVDVKIIGVGFAVTDRKGFIQGEFRYVVQDNKHNRYMRYEDEVFLAE
jgi:hypothetical protein